MDAVSSTWHGRAPSPLPERAAFFVPCTQNARVCTLISTGDFFPPLAPPPFYSQFTATVLSPHPCWTDRHLPMVYFTSASLQKRFPQTFSLCPSAMYTASEDTEYVKNHLSPDRNVLGKTTSNKNKTEGFASHPTWAQTFSRPVSP